MEHFSKGKTLVEEKQGTSPSDNNNEDFPGYNELSPLTKMTLSLEKLLNGAVGKKGATSQIVASKKDAIEPLLDNLIGCMQPGAITYVESLQIRRFTNTMEFDTLDTVQALQAKKKKVLSLLKNLTLKDVSPKLEDEKLQSRQIELMYAAISDLWPISIQDFAKFVQNLKFARHGETSVSGKASWIQIEGCFAELMICRTMVQLIAKHAVQHGALYKWSPDGLMLQILQNTARRYKVKTILESVTIITGLQPLLLAQVDKGCITKLAFTSIQGCLQDYVVGAVSDKIKEQSRQLQILTSVIQQRPEFVCVGYEALVSNASGSDIRADILFDGGNASKFAIEIESLADKNQADAYKYLKDRYEKKMETIGNAVKKEGYSLVLVLPLGTQVPQEQWELIQKDGSIRVWLIEK